MEKLDNWYYAQKCEREVFSKMTELFYEEGLKYSYTENNDNTIIVPVRKNGAIYCMEINVRYNSTLTVIDGRINDFDIEEEEE